MKSKIIYVDFIKKRKISRIHFHINKIKNYIFNNLDSNAENSTSNLPVIKTNNIRHIVNKIY